MMNSEKIAVLLVDDEKPVREALREMLRGFGQIEVVGEASTLPEAVREIHRLKPQLIFLDIEMPGYTGLQLLEFFNPQDITFDIVFVTAYSEYAIQAFKISAFDYLLKPVNRQELSQMLHRYESHKDQQKVTERMALLRDVLHQDVPNKKIAISSANGISFIELEEVVLLEAAGAYTTVVLQSGEQIVSSKPIGEFESLLENDPGFFKTHRSYIIHFKFVKSLQTKEGDQVLMKNGTLVPLSRYRKKAFDDYIRDMKV